MSLQALRAALDRGDDAAALGALDTLGSADHAGAAPLALHLGRPSLAVRWAGDPLTLAAAWLRLGDPRAALGALRGQKGGARPALLRARAAWQLGQEDAAELAAHARRLARAEGDAGALAAAATLLGEVMLWTDPRAALRALAEGLKVAELAGTGADPHLLAVLAHTQAAVGSREKAARTAAKALDRSLPRSPARVLALLALGREEEARAEAREGELGDVWGRAFLVGDQAR
ncbi:hypothetical protein [Deinococcus planocerae]|uniref:hypothetical protein n=1 Tax=Deinococcus planocerae TaxID=1737569 RepID=UPI000C7EB963|nr:hypothetical protein [Deinococcus planocerae]